MSAKCIKLLFIIWVMVSLLIPQVWASASAQQWFSHLIEDVYQSRNNVKKQQPVLIKLKSSFAIKDMVRQAYGDRFRTLRDKDQHVYIKLMEQFFESAVIKVLFKKQLAKNKVTYKLFPVKKSTETECATQVMGDIEFEQRVDWTIIKPKEKELFETRFCIREKSKQKYEIVDLVVEGVSWVKDLEDEIQRFYKDGLSQKKSIDQIHGELVKKIQAEIKKIETTNNPKVKTS
jgi:ABC-type transporter MlaC component